jgi:hypothetical protein
MPRRRPAPRRRMDPANANLVEVLCPIGHAGHIQTETQRTNDRQDEAAGASTIVCVYSTLS